MNINAILTELGDIARGEPSLRVDVRSQVLRTIAVKRPVKQLDWVPLAAGAVALATAAIVTITLMPTLNMMLEPWVGYFPK